MLELIVTNLTLTGQVYSPYECRHGRPVAGGVIWLLASTLASAEGTTVATIDEAELVFRDATAQDWPNIWPIFQIVVTAGDTYAYRPDTTQTEAEAPWMQPEPTETSRIWLFSGPH